MADSRVENEFDPRVVLESLGQAVIATDLDGVVTYWNDAAEKLYGWTAGEAIGCQITTLTVPEVTQPIAEQIMDALREGTAWSGGFSVRRKDGTMFPALVTDAGIYRDGALVGIVGVSANLGTALRPLLQRSSDAALLLRADLMIMFASSAVRTLFGWDDDAVVGTSLVPQIFPGDRPALAEFAHQAVTRPGTYAPLDVRVRRESGWVWAELALTSMLDDPVVHGLVCNLRLNVARIAREAAETRAAQLQSALDTRLGIERAKGFLAGRHGVSAQAAFEALRRYARANNRTVRDVAEEVNEGTLDLTVPAG
jgi:PAS domain S-box-containing protein